MSPAVMLHGRAGTMKAPFGSTREQSISKIRHKSMRYRWETYAGHTTTFGGYGFLLSKFFKEIMALENKKNLHEGSGGRYLALPRR